MGHGTKIGGLLALALLAGCGSQRTSLNPSLKTGPINPTYACTMEARSGLSVKLRLPSGVSAQSVAADLAVTINDGQGAQTLDKDAQSSTTQITFFGAYESAGTFQIIFYYRGSVVSQLSGISVAMDGTGCHVKTNVVDTAIQGSQVVLLSKTY